MKYPVSYFPPQSIADIVGQDNIYCASGTDAFFIYDRQLQIA